MAKAKTDEKVMAMVERELEKNPEISVDELQKKGASINKDVASLTARQFHARYPLQVKRRKAMAADGGTATKRKKARERKPRKKRARRATDRQAAGSTSSSEGTAVDRDAVRKSFLSFASELTAAEARKDLVKVLAGVDKYVDQVVKASGR